MENERTQTRCPKCGRENPQGARFCCSCGGALTQAEVTGQTVSVKVSRMALASFIGAISGLALVMPALIAISARRSRLYDSNWPGVAFLIGVVVLGVAGIMGALSIVRIERDGGRITGRPVAIGSILIAILGLALWPVWTTVMPRTRSVACRNVCGYKLGSIGKAMLIYCNDYGDELPRSGGISSMWAERIPD